MWPQIDKEPTLNTDINNNNNIIMIKYYYYYHYISAGNKGTWRSNLITNNTINCIFVCLALKWYSD